MGRPTLREELAEAEARAAHLKRRIAGEGCIVAGHDWQMIGGKNAACELGSECRCSVPVNVCTVCSDCDYGDNPEAHEIVGRCAMEAGHGG